MQLPVLLLQPAPLLLLLLRRRYDCGLIRV
jgi:hypothetical protein